MEYKRFEEKICDLQSDWNVFKVDFVDTATFCEFANHLLEKVGGYSEVCITGYFSETVRDELQRIAAGKTVRLISPELQESSPRDKKNKQALKKLSDSGVQVRINSRLHARFLIAHTPGFTGTVGLLLIGSFDFNTECIGKERYDAGIITTHPDLVKAAISYSTGSGRTITPKAFEEILNAMSRI